MKVSAVLITRNADAHLDRGLASLQWCDEIVVRDQRSIDADEEVTPELRDAVRALPDDPAPVAYSVNRLSRFLGR